MLVDRDDAGRSGGKRVVQLVADAGLHAVARELPRQSADGGADGGRRQQRRGEEPDDETDAGADLDALAAEVVAGLLDVHLALGVLDDERHAVGDDLAVACELDVGVEVLLRQVGDEVDGDQDVQLLVVTHGAPLSPPSQALAACAARA